MNKLNYHWIIQSMHGAGCHIAQPMNTDTWLKTKGHDYIERMPVHNKLDGYRVFVSKDFKTAIMTMHEDLFIMRICQDCLNDVFHMNHGTCNNCQLIKEGSRTVNNFFAIKTDKGKRTIYGYELERVRDYICERPWFSSLCKDDMLALTKGKEWVQPPYRIYNHFPLLDLLTKNDDFEDLEGAYNESPMDLALMFGARSSTLCYCMSFFELSEERQREAADLYDEESESMRYFVEQADEDHGFWRSMHDCIKTSNEGDTFHGSMGDSNSSGYGVILSSCGEAAIVFHCY